MQGESVPTAHDISAQLPSDAAALAVLISGGIVNEAVGGNVGTVCAFAGLHKAVDATKYDAEKPCTV